MSFSHESPYSSRIGAAAAESPLVSRRSFHAVSCDFPTDDISTAQALLFESAGCAAGPAGEHKDRRAASLASVRTGSRSPGGLARSPGGLARSPGGLARSCGTPRLARPPGVCARTHAPTHRNACGRRRRSLRSCPALRFLLPAPFVQLANQQVLQQQHVDHKIANVLKKGTREAYKTWTQQDRAWVDMRLHESHDSSKYWTVFKKFASQSLHNIKFF
jgi:hypothetical protein